MSIQVVLLRGINVGGHNLIAMPALRELLSEMGFADVQTLLQSGNVVFRSKKLSGAGLERRLESESTERLGVTIDYMVRSAAEWAQVVARNPFEREAEDDPGHLLVMCLKSVPPVKLEGELREKIRGPESVHLDGRQLYIMYPAGVGRSKLTGALIERTLDTRGTARNWNTVLKLAALCNSGCRD
ncbi:MAG: DUF1697 domain-containing protein [Phycisphaerae bacterium]